MFQYRHMILCSVAEVYIFEHGRYISQHGTGWDVNIYLLSYLLLACKNTNYKCCHTWLIYFVTYEVSILGFDAQHLRFETFYQVIIRHFVPIKA